MEAYLNPSIKSYLEEDCDLTNTRSCMFRSMIFYFADKSNNEDDNSSFAKRLNETQIKFCGGALSDVLDNRVTHVIVNDIDNVDEVVVDKRKQRIMEGWKIFHTVSHDWLKESFHNGKLSKYVK